ncbi:hypothetical protein F7725_009556, partial [Dissostichus mawsoni]
MNKFGFAFIHINILCEIYASVDIMYLKVADNNRSDTHLVFFNEAVNEHGYPLRIERLWRDVFMSVTGVFYNTLHSLEEQHLLDISSILHIFCCHYVFLPRIQANLDVFTEAWANHPIRTEQNMTPNQLWQVGQALHPVADPEAVEKLGGCPRIVRGDKGTENVKVRDFQRFVRRNIQDRSAIDSYIEGASTANQRIDSWWGFLRRESMEFYICMFTDLKNRGLFDGAFLDKSVLQFCFMGIIQ